MTKEEFANKVARLGNMSRAEFDQFIGPSLDALLAAERERCVSAIRCAFHEAAEKVRSLQ